MIKGKINIDKVIREIEEKKQHSRFYDSLVYNRALNKAIQIIKDNIQEEPEEKDIISSCKHSLFHACNVDDNKNTYRCSECGLVIYYDEGKNLFSSMPEKKKKKDCFDCKWNHNPNDICNICHAWSKFEAK